MIHQLRAAALRLPAPLKKIVKETDLMGRRLTAPWRDLPTFLIIGAQKSGTTSLYEYLVKHPSIVPARTKEVHFFDTEAFSQGARWYRAQFPLQLQRQIMLRFGGGYYQSGEATTYYLFHPDVPSRVYTLLPQVKLIAILRNPIDRAFSHYHHERRKGRESLSFEDALAREEDRLASVVNFPRPFDGDVFRQQSYKAGGRYTEQLARWLIHYPREQLLVLSSEEMFTDPDRVLAQVCEFLELPNWQPKGLKPFNAGRYKSQMKPETRKMLDNYFAPHNIALAQQLEKTFPW